MKANAYRIHLDNACSDRTRLGITAKIWIPPDFNTSDAPNPSLDQLNQQLGHENLKFL
jgi:predicted deacetylase